MIFQYDGTYEGFLCTVFEIYAMHLANDAQIHPADGCLTLEESRTVENQSGKADRVSQRLKQLGIAIRGQRGDAHAEFSHNINGLPTDRPGRTENGYPGSQAQRLLLKRHAQHLQQCKRRRSGKEHAVKAV